jgi:hypothetical protein
MSHFVEIFYVLTEEFKRNTMKTIDRDSCGHVLARGGPFFLGLIVLWIKSFAKNKQKLGRSTISEVSRKIFSV